MKSQINKWHRYLCLRLHQKGVEVTHEEVKTEIRELIKMRGRKPVDVNELVTYLCRVFKSMR